MQRRNMCDFIQAPDHQWSWHAKVQDLNLHRFLVNNLYKVLIYEILYRILLWNSLSFKFYCRDLFERILTKFSLYFSEVHISFYEFWMFKTIQKWSYTMGSKWPKDRHWEPGPKAKTAHGACDAASRHRTVIVHARKGSKMGCAV
jgi:hypothetical protein